MEWRSKCHIYTSVLKPVVCILFYVTSLCQAFMPKSLRHVTWLFNNVCASRLVWKSGCTDLIWASLWENRFSGFLTWYDTNGLCSHRWLEGWNFVYRKKRDCTIYVQKAKALISFAVTAKLICAFVFTYAKNGFLMMRLNSKEGPTRTSRSHLAYYAWSIIKKRIITRILSNYGTTFFKKTLLQTLIFHKCKTIWFDKWPSPWEHLLTFYEDKSFAQYQEHRHSRISSFTVCTPFIKDIYIKLLNPQFSALATAV